MNIQKYAARSLYWGVSEQCMNIKLYELNQNSPEKKEFSPF